MKAIEVKPSTGSAESWAEYDGVWSVFNLQVGSNSQHQSFRFVPSSSSYSTWLPAADSCAKVTDQSSCASARGIGPALGAPSTGYAGNRSSSYVPMAVAYIELGSHLKIDTLFGADYKISAANGLDFVSLQRADNSWMPDLQKTAIYADATTFYILPTFGLGFGQRVEPDGTTISSFLEALAVNNSIPSRSWGYTAGARYHNPGVGSRGSLVLGGYDNARIDSNKSATLRIPEETGELLVQVSSVTIQSASKLPVSNITQFQAVIDTTLPYMYLPRQVCDFFVEHFSLTEDTSRGLFILNQTTLDINTRDTTGIEFRIGDALGGDNATTITLPYDAFDATAHESWEYETSDQRIFPMMLQVGDVAVLGRTFFHEAYIHANYEPDVRQFNISQRSHPGNTAPPEIVTVRGSSITWPEDPDDGGLSRGALAGIIVGAVLSAALITVGIWFFFRHRSKKRKAALAAQNTMTEKGDNDPTLDIMGELRRGTISSNWSATATEVDGSSYPNSPRPTHARQLSNTPSELSSDADHERGHSMMATLHETCELGDKMDAATYEALERRMKIARGATPNGPSPMEPPRELSGSHDWINPDRRGSAPNLPSPGTVTPQPVSPQPQPDAQRPLPLFNDREQLTTHLTPDSARQS